eukprot:1392246-Amorphochlora_amoeboformis.AAC.1
MVQRDVTLDNIQIFCRLSEPTNSTHIRRGCQPGCCGPKPDSGMKRRTPPGRSTGSQSKRPKPQNDDFFIESESSGDEAEAEGGVEDVEEIDPFANETADERRVRIAKEYLSKIEGLPDELSDNEGVVDGDATKNLGPVALRLHREALKLKGKLKRAVAEKIGDKKVEQFVVKRLRGHRLPVTCVALGVEGRVAYSGSKDGSIIQ